MHTVSVPLVKASPRDTTNGDDPDLAQFEQYMSRVSRDLASNRRRFYLRSWQPMLDGDLALVCSWGRPETHSRSRTIFSPERAQLQEKLVGLIKRRLQRGYQVATWH